MRRVVALGWIVVASHLGAQIRPIDPPAAPDSGMPHFAKAPDGTLYVAWTDTLETKPGEAKQHALRFSRWTASSWTSPETIATGANWFVNWADFPSLSVAADGSMLAHWLTRSGEGSRFGYGIRIARRDPSTAKWSEIHGLSLDEKTDYAGFLSFVPGERTAVFLSPPREKPHHLAADASDAHDHLKTVRAISFNAAGKVEKDIEVDADACSCCPTSIGRTQRGLIAVYRDHTPGVEIRDIAVIRQIDGAWTQPRTLHADGWKINGCPTDGPSLATHASKVAVAWLTRANDQPRVQLSLSRNNGESFDKPIRLDSGNPLGRPSIVANGDGSFVVVWLEKTGAEQNQIRMRRVSVSGALSEPRVIADVPAGRASGFPKVAVSGQQILVAWRDQKVRAVLLTN